MNAKILITIQLTSFIIMLGTAEQLFTKTFPTILFLLSLILFAKSSIYIGKNEKWLIKDFNKEQKMS